MKRTIIILTCMLLLFSLAACGSSAAEPAISILDGAYSCTPQEFIDLINEAAKSVGEDYFTIPDFQKSREEIKINGTRLTIKLTENESGNLTKIHLYWYSGDNNANTIKSAALYVGRIASLLSPNDSNEIGKEISEIVDKGYGSVSATKNGSTFSFEATTTGANRLDVEPKSDG